MGVIERFDSQPVSCKKQGFVSLVPNREGEHSIEPREAFISPLAIRVDEHLGIGFRPEDMPQSFEVSPQFLEVINLTVICEEDFTAAIRHRLVPGGREVDYRKPPVPQAHSTGRELTYVDSLVIGPPMSYAHEHFLDKS